MKRLGVGLVLTTALLVFCFGCGTSPLEKYERSVADVCECVNAGATGCMERFQYAALLATKSFDNRQDHVDRWTSAHAKLAECSK